MTVTTRHHLIEFLLAEEDRAAAAGCRISETGGWGAAIELTKTWKAVPRLFERVRSLRLKITPAETGRLKLEYLRAYQHTASRATRAIAAMRALEEAGIRAAVFKGLASIAVLYGDCKRRSIQDADLLILKKDLPRALECLGIQGFERTGPETLSQYLRFVEESPGFAGNQALTVQDQGGCEIDLHWEVAGSGLCPEEILGRAARGALMDTMIPVVDSSDGFVLTVHHAVRENLAVETACRDLVDAGLWLRHLRGTGRLDECIERAARSQCKVAALAISMLLGGYDRNSAATQTAAVLSRLASPAERRSAQSLLELFQYQLTNGRLDKDVFYLVHSRPWRQILKGLAKDWSGYRRSMRSWEEKLGEHRPWHDRAATLVRSIPGLRGLRLARQLACIKFGPY